MMRRRRFLAASGAALAGASLPALAQAPASRGGMLPTHDISALVAKVTGGRPVEKGGVTVELPPLAENGNSVPLHVKVASPMTKDDRVTDLHVFAERNPRPHVASYHFGPSVARAEITTRMRLAVEQKVTVIAVLSGGRFRSGEAVCVVTSAACLDEGP